MLFVFFLLSEGSTIKIFSSTKEFHTASTLLAYYGLQDIKNYKHLVTCFGIHYLPSFVKIRLWFQNLFIWGQAESTHTDMTIKCACILINKET
jgi:hypothetical protein